MHSSYSPLRFLQLTSFVRDNHLGQSKSSLHLDGEGSAESSLEVLAQKLLRGPPETLLGDCAQDLKRLYKYILINQLRTTKPEVGKQKEKVGRTIARKNGSGLSSSGVINWSMNCCSLPRGAS